MAKKKDKSKKVSTITVFGYKFITYNFFLTLICIAISICGIISFLHQREMLKNSSYTTGKIVRVGKRPGITTASECQYEYIVNGQKCRRTSLRSDVNIDDCYEVKYSLKEPEISELNIENGKVPCH